MRIAKISTFEDTGVPRLQESAPPQDPTLLGTASHFCEVFPSPRVVLATRTRAATPHLGFH